MQQESPFVNEPPKTDHEVLRDVWYSCDEILREHIPAIKAKQDKTNGRVTKLERFAWAVGGGLTVVTVIVVPLFLWLVQR